MTNHPNDMTQPLRLAVGSHKAGSGKGCAMNVISWENGDKEITDLPDCADEFLAKLVQQVNDSHCKHLTRAGVLGTEDNASLLCPPCSVEVLALAHRTVGTRRTVAPTGAYLLIAAEWANAMRGPRKDAARSWVFDARRYPSDVGMVVHCTTNAIACAAGPSPLANVHRVIDRFEELTGVKARETDPEATRAAVEAMQGAGK